eukprot:1665572-Ditylum_brightwellii.AAC.1
MTEKKQPNGEYNHQSHQANYTEFPPLTQQETGHNMSQPATTPKGGSDAIEAHFRKKLEDMKSEMRGEMK